jgi:hypothetical protein
MRALLAKEPLPEEMMLALEQICKRAVERQARIFIDAEQQSVQPGIDDVALGLMEKFNVDGNIVVFNTYQAYLRITPAILLEHLDIADKKRFTLGIKLVRGAYINSEPRGVINDTKADTDVSYDALAQGIIKRELGRMSWLRQDFLLRRCSMVNCLAWLMESAVDCCRWDVLKQMVLERYLLKFSNVLVGEH